MSKPTEKLACILLAAGRGTRMQSNLPKVMHPVGGWPLIRHVAMSAAHLNPSHMAVVVAPHMDAVVVEAKQVFADCEAVIQDQQLGTGHAVNQTKEMLKGFAGTAIILYGDTPLIEPETLRQLLAGLESASASVAVLGCRLADPTGYGRLILNDSGMLERIVEHKDANADELTVTLCNSGVMAVKTPLLFDLLEQLEPNNANGEYYLTDVVSLARGRDLNVAMVEADANELQGANTRAQLAHLEHSFQQRKRAQIMASGVTLIAPETIFFAADTVIGQDSIVHPHVVFGSGVTIGSGVQIKSFSHIEQASIESNCIIGPYARLRPGSQLAEGVRIGNFVEIKQSSLGAGAKINHLSYVGDAVVGEHVNIGAGTITCNYDGKQKHQTTIETGAFIGSNTALVAPVTIGAGATIGAGSTITKDVPSSALAVSRAEQKTKQNWKK